MRETMLGILEGLESFQPDSEKWRQFLRRLFLLTMGEYRAEEDQAREERKEEESQQEEAGKWRQLVVTD